MLPVPVTPYQRIFSRMVCPGSSLPLSQPTNLCNQVLFPPNSMQSDTLNNDIHNFNSTYSSKITKKVAAKPTVCPAHYMSCHDHRDPYNQPITKFPQPSLPSSLFSITSYYPVKITISSMSTFYIAVSLWFDRPSNPSSAPAPLPWHFWYCTWFFLLIPWDHQKGISVLHKLCSLPCSMLSFRAPSCAPKCLTCTLWFPYSKFSSLPLKPFVIKDVHTFIHSLCPLCFKAHSNDKKLAPLVPKPKLYHIANRLLHVLPLCLNSRPNIDMTEAKSLPLFKSMLRNHLFGIACP